MPGASSTASFSQVTSSLAAKRGPVPEATGMAPNSVPRIRPCPSA